jgi:outer membrane cobalamin receptor
MFVCLTSFAAVRAQENVTLRLENVSAEELFRAIERLTSYRIYCRPTDTDSVIVSVASADEGAEDVLRKALLPAGLKVSAFGDALFVAKDWELVTALPPNYYGTVQDAEAAAIAPSRLPTANGRAGRKASSENIVYEIGSATAAATTGKARVNGIVTDFRSGEPVSGVALFIQETMTGTTTDSAGFYSLDLPAGRCELNIRAVGMKDARRLLQVYSPGRLDIELDEQSYAIDEITISSQRLERIRTATIGVERLAIKDMKNIPTAFGEVDILKVVLSLPGVKSVGEASGGFNVRGGATDQNLILFNGGTVYNPTHLFGFFSAFNPDVIQDMELYKSSVPPQYGGRISSVLEVGSREGNKQKFQGSASLGLLTSRLTLEGPLGGENTSVLAGFRTTYSDWILKSLPENSGYSAGTAGFYDANLSLSHRFDERNNVSLNGYLSRDRFQFDAYEKYAYRNANASLKWRHIFGHKLTGVFTAGYDHYDFHTQNADNPSEAYRYSFGIEQGFGKADLSWYAHDNHTFDFGLSALYYNLNPGAYLPEGAESFVTPNRLQRETAIETAVYAGDRWDVSPSFSLNIGLRYSLFGVPGLGEENNVYSTQVKHAFYPVEHAFDPGQTRVSPGETQVSTRSANNGSGIPANTDTNTDKFRTYQGPEYRLSARYAFAEDWSVKAGINTMRQYIHKLSNTTVMSPTDTWKLSDAHIRPQSGGQIAAGIYRNFAGHTIETSLEVYYKTMSDYLDYRKGAELQMNPHIEREVLPVQGRAYGVELMARKTQGKLNGWVSYTYARTELRQSDPAIADPVNNGQWYPADFDKPHDFKLAGNYRFTHRFSVSLNCDYSTGRPVTLPVSKYRIAGGEYVYYSERNQYRIPDFFRVDLSINIEPSHHLTLLTHSSFSLGVYNLTGRKNAYSVYYVAQEGELQGYRLAIFGMPIPYISYNIKF